MDTQPIVKYLSGITQLSSGLIKEIEAGTKKELYKNRQVIQAQGLPETRAWFIEKGIARSYIYDNKGMELTMRFWGKGEFIFSNGALLNIPSLLYIEMLDDSELHSIPYQQVLQLLKTFPETARLVSTIVNEGLKKDLDRYLLFALTPEKRYLKLREENPEVFQRSPLRIIASFLHISRESLSRIINRESK
jgi:CRP-like cAMP-binding protein